MMKENIINRIPLKIYRDIRYRYGVYKEYRKNCALFSKEYGKICKNAVMASYNDLPLNHVLSLYDIKDNYILNYLEELCSDVILQYQNNEFSHNHNTHSKKIWVFWWDGFDSAPEIVKACIKSIHKHANGHEVCLLDKSNYLQYITIPESIQKKHDIGLIGHAHYSDIIRFSLLSNYGGVWIDATVFLTQPLPASLFTCDYFSLKSNNPHITYYSKSRWCSYFLAGNNTQPLFSFMRDFLIYHWEHTDTIIDYLIIDYAIGIAYNHFPEVKQAIDNVPENNTLRGDLMRLINEPYSEELFAKLRTQDTFASKLSWRYGNPKSHCDDGSLTNYGYILSL